MNTSSKIVAAIIIAVALVWYLLGSLVAERIKAFTVKNPALYNRRRAVLVHLLLVGPLGWFELILDLAWYSVGFILEICVAKIINWLTQ